MAEGKVDERAGIAAVLILPAVLRGVGLGSDHLGGAGGGLAPMNGGGTGTVGVVGGDACGVLPDGAQNVDGGRVRGVAAVQVLPAGLRGVDLTDRVAAFRPGVTDVFTVAVSAVPAGERLPSTATQVVS